MKHEPEQLLYPFNSLLLSSSAHPTGIFVHGRRRRSPSNYLRSQLVFWQLAIHVTYTVSKGGLAICQMCHSMGPTVDPGILAKGVVVRERGGTPFR